MALLGDMMDKRILYPGKMGRIQVKICGITDVPAALSCLALGADAIGLVFYPKSPRYVTDDRAKAICAALEGRIPGVGVFVNEPGDAVLDRARRCGLSVVQLHGDESPQMVRQLRKEGLTVLKALFYGKNLNTEMAAQYAPDAFLAECGGGKLPGGNAMDWDWALAKPLAEQFPIVLAGGLSVKNVAAALKTARPDAVDVSSGVESAPGVKDLHRVKLFLEAVAAYRHGDAVRKIF